MNKTENDHSPESVWSHRYAAQSMAYPAEYVIRIFKGRFPRVNLDKDQLKGAKILDVGCGDGRHIPLFVECGMKPTGVEIDPEIVESIRQNLTFLDSEQFDLATGSNNHLPFDQAHFDFLISWNACYYIGEEDSFTKTVSEFARVIKPGGTLIVSIPKKTCFIYKDAKPLDNGLVEIQDDFFKLRNGHVLKRFENAHEIEKTFAPYFSDFAHASIHDDCFGLNYHWHLFVCKRKD